MNVFNIKSQKVRMGHSVRLQVLGGGGGDVGDGPRAQFELRLGDRLAIVNSLTTTCQPSSLPANPRRWSPRSSELVPRMAPL